jgi:methylated-DNA-protein-cysteine methyltransferase-like protein
MEKKHLFNKIRKVVARIPKGKVTTYGAIARFLGTKDARLVGYAMFGNQNPKIPCHRVVKKEGFLAKDYSLGGWQEQKRRLERERVKFLKENQADLKKHFWQPK